MGNLNLKTRIAFTNSEVSVLEAEGELDINTVGDFENALGDFMRKKKFKIVLNFGKLTYISSAGIGVVVGNLKEIRKNRGDIRISNVNQEIFKVFDLLELRSILHIFKTEMEAVQKF